jgi:RNA polymerase sigma factor (sigma-70 family)
MKMTDSQQLLAEYVRTGSDAAFRELVARFVDPVFSTALRLVGGDAHRAEDVAQTVFADLARKASTVSTDVVLGGWLHRHVCFVAANILRSERRRQFRERQAVEMNTLQNDSGTDFSTVAPILDEAINQLGEEDRTAILLRFFEQRDFRSVGELLGSNEDAARMRVNRALEKLHVYLGRRGVKTTAGALSVVLAANAVQAAPAGLAATISATAALAGTSAAASANVLTTTIIMTTFQKTILGVSLVTAIGTGFTSVYQARQNAALKQQVLSLEQQQAPLVAQLQALEAERDQATNQLASLAEHNAAMKQKPDEVLRLRGEVGRLRRESVEASSISALNKVTGNSEARQLLRGQQKITMAAIYSDFAKLANLTKEQSDKFTEVLADHVMDSIDRITEALRDNPSREQLNQLFSAQNAATTGKVQELLGSEAAAQYADYTKNLASSITAQQFYAQLTGDAGARADKAARLHQLMQQERDTALAEAGLPPDFQIIPTLNFSNIASESEAEKNLKLFDDIYARVAAKAGAFLSPEELERFAAMRSAALTQTRSTLSVNRKLMAPISN